MHALHSPARRSKFRQGHLYFVFVQREWPTSLRRVADPKLSLSGTSRQNLGMPGSRFVTLKNILLHSCSWIRNMSISRTGTWAGLLLLVPLLASIPRRRPYPHLGMPHMYSFTSDMTIQQRLWCRNATTCHPYEDRGCKWERKGKAVMLGRRLYYLVHIMSKTIRGRYLHMRYLVLQLKFCIW